MLVLSVMLVSIVSNGRISLKRSNWKKNILAAPLSDLTRKGQPNKVEWGEAQEKTY